MENDDYNNSNLPFATVAELLQDVQSYGRHKMRTPGPVCSYKEIGSQMITWELAGNTRYLLSMTGCSFS